ncbi:MAG: ABC transporter ATP-binding protein [Dehalococcoidales bacterium]|nr:ABC transporter ATP-binding protein [Dehalococcoidales bacterium]
MTEHSVIHTENLTKHYGDVKALVDLNLDIPAGEIFGFLGPNGAGKTTTIRTLLDEIRPTSGKASILGLDTHKKSVEIRKHIGYLPGDLAMYPGLTGRDTLTYFANLRGGVDWQYVDQLADRLNADLSKKVGDLSSGNRQKVGLIQAFMNKPEVLILDEPSSGLDPLIQREFQSMLREASKSGCCVFLSSHTLSEVQHVADRVGIIRQGILAAVEYISQLRSKAMRRIELDFEEHVEREVFEAIPGTRDISVGDTRVILSYDGKMEEMLRVVMDKYELLDIRSQEADLEEIFLTYYRGEEVAA